jgi:hypothetical protein
LLVWFGEDASRRSTCERLLKANADTIDSQVAERVAKIASLYPLQDTSMKEAARALAERAARLAKNDSTVQPWAQLTLGMAEYRVRDYPAADAALTTAIEMPSAPDRYSALIRGTASFYRVMSLFHQGKLAASRELFNRVEAQMQPLPTDENNPLADAKADHDDLILWLAYKEARALLNTP